MAKEFPSEDGELQNAINCPVCFEPMFDSLNFFPCNHSFCEACVRCLKRHWYGGQWGITCPMCRCFIGEYNVKPHMLVNSLVRHFIKQQSRQAFCFQCPSEELHSRCIPCNINLCKSCHKAHILKPGFSQHKIIDCCKPDFIGSMPCCSIHPDEPIRMNCLTCERAICSTCKFCSHDTHQSETVASAASRYREIVNTTLGNIQALSEEERAVLLRLKKQRDTIKTNEHEILSQLIAKKNEIIEQTHKQYDHLLRLVSTQNGAQVKQIESKIGDVELSLARKNSFKSCTDGMDRLNHAEYTSIFQTRVLSTISQLKVEEKTVPQKCDFIFKFQSSDLKSLFGKLVWISDKSDEFDGETVLSLSRFKSSLDSSPQPTELEVSAWQQKAIDLFNAVNEIGNCRNNHFDDFTNLASINYKEVQSNTVIRQATKMYIFQDTMWIIFNSFRKSGIKIYALPGFQSTKCINILGYVRSVQPLYGKFFVVATSSGLYIIDSSIICGQMNKEPLYKGNVHDVCVQGQFMVVLFCNENKQYIEIWQIEESEDSLKKKCSFSGVDHTQAIANTADGEPNIGTSTLYIKDSIIYLCDVRNHNIYKYVEGIIIATYSSLDEMAGLLHCPKICGIDRKGNLLILNTHLEATEDEAAKKLKILDKAGKWSLVTKNFQNVNDVIALDSVLYILHSDAEQNQARITTYHRDTHQ